MNLDDEFGDGYMDGRDKDCPEPSENRSEAYRHSFGLGRREIQKQPLPKAQDSRRRAEEIKRREMER